MKPFKRDFRLRDEEEQDILISDAWCTSCEDENLGLEDPHEYEANGVIFLEGRCVQCGNSVVTSIETVDTHS